MIRSYYRDPSGQRRADLSPAALQDAIASRSGLIWVDLEAATREEAVPVLRDLFGFHDLTIDDCLNGRVDPPKVDDYDGYLFVVLQTLRSPDNVQQVQVDELDLYVGDNYVVSFHTAPLPALEGARTAWERGAPLACNGPDRLAHDIMDRVVDEFLPVVEAIDDEVEAIEEAIINTAPGSDVLESVLALRRTTVRLRRTIAPQRDVVNRISRGEFRHRISGDLLMYYRDIYDHLVRVEDMTSSVREAVDGVIGIYLSSTSNRTNEIIKVLSIVATIILPLTLVTGIYGMNFRFMPELDTRYGYPVVLLAMAAVALALVGYFRYRRWI